MIQQFFKSNWQYLGVVALFLTIAGVYFLPSWSGYTLSMGDITNWKGMSKELRDYRERTGEEAVWTNSSFSGMPGYQISVNYTNPIKSVYNTIVGFLGFPVAGLFFSFLCFFILCRAFNAGFYLAIIGALAYGLNTYNILIMEAGHSSKMMAVAFIPGVLAGIIMMYRNKQTWFSFAVLAFFVALELLVNHIQMTYYFSMVMLVLVVAEFFRFKKNNEVKRYFQRTALIVAAGLIGAVANFANYYHTYAFSKETMRGKPALTIEANDNSGNSKNLSSGLDRDYIVQWCYGKEETYNLLVPNAKGDARNLTGEFFDQLRTTAPGLYNFCVEQYQNSRGKAFGGYWGDQPFTSGPNYIGALVVLLALLYILLVKGPMKWALVAVSLLAILLSWGKNLGGSVEDMWLTNFFIDYVPMYNKFRAVSSILVIVNLLAPLMAVLFIKHLIDHREWAKEQFKKITWTGGGVLGVVLLFTLFPGFFDFTSQQEQLFFNSLYQQYSANPEATKGINPLEAESALIEFRQGVFQADSYRTLGFMAVGLLVLLLFIKDKLKVNVALPVLMALVLLDSWNINKRYLNNDKNPANKREYLYWEKQSGNENSFVASEGDHTIFAIEAQKNPALPQLVEQGIQELRKTKRKSLTNKDMEDVKFSVLNLNTNYRVMNLSNPFNSAEVSYFHKSSGGYSPAKLGRYQDLIDFYIADELQLLQQQQPEAMKVLNMLNTVYYLYNGKLVFQNPYAYGNAWFIDQIKEVNSADEAILAIADTDLKRTAIVNTEFSENYAGVVTTTPDSNASIEMLSYAPNELVYRSNSSAERIAVFSEVYYADGWHAYIDGNPAPHFRANYILRAMKVPAGQHEIRFVFKPTMLQWSNLINLIGFLMILLALLFSGFKIYKERKQSSGNPS
jgi:hypothetical protein